jgi:hypothetical protein
VPPSARQEANHKLEDRHHRRRLYVVHAGKTRRAPSACRDPRERLRAKGINWATAAFNSFQG